MIVKGLIVRDALTEAGNGGVTLPANARAVAGCAKWRAMAAACESGSPARWSDQRPKCGTAAPRPALAPNVRVFMPFWRVARCRTVVRRQKTRCLGHTVIRLMVIAGAILTFYAATAWYQNSDEFHQNAPSIIDAR